MRARLEGIDCSAWWLSPTLTGSQWELHLALPPSSHTQDLSLRTQVLENYFLLVSAMEDNLAEFKHIQEQLTEVTADWLSVNLYSLGNGITHSMSCPVLSMCRDDWQTVGTKC